MRQTVKLRDGQQIVVYGEVSLYEARGQYQMIVRAVVDDGVGRLQREFEALKRRLAQEHRLDREAYTQAKGPFIDRITEMALDIGDA